MDLLSVVGTLGVLTAAVASVIAAINGHNKATKDDLKKIDQRFDEAKKENKEAHDKIGENIKGVQTRINDETAKINDRLHNMGLDLAFLAGRRQGEADALARKNEK